MKVWVIEQPGTPAILASSEEKVWEILEEINKNDLDGDGVVMKMTRDGEHIFELLYNDEPEAFARLAVVL